MGFFERFDFKAFRKPLLLNSDLSKPISLDSSSKELRFQKRFEIEWLLDKYVPSDLDVICNQGKIIVHKFTDINKRDFSLECFTGFFCFFFAMNSKLFRIFLKFPNFLRPDFLNCSVTVWHLVHSPCSYSNLATIHFWW